MDGRVRTFWHEIRSAEAAGASPQIKTAAKAAFIFLANLVVVIFVASVQRWGYVEGKKANLAPFMWLEAVNVVLILFPLLLLQLGQNLSSWLNQMGLSLSPSPEPGAKTSIVSRFLDDAWPNWSLGYRAAITALMYAAVTILVRSTGGSIAGPFGQFPVAVVILAPIIMTSIRTKLWNIGLGAVYVGVLFWVTTDAGRDRLGVRYEPWVWALGAVIVLAISLMLGLLQDIGKVRRWRADLKPATLTVPQTGPEGQ